MPLSTVDSTGGVIISEKIKERMKQFGMSDDRVEEIVKRVRGEGGGS